MIYQPEEGCIWDPTVLYVKDTYYMVSMYKPSTSHNDNYMWLAKSEDGAHWQSVGSVIEDLRGVCKMYMYETEDGIGLNFGSFSEGQRVNNDALRYYKSYDMINWEYVGENHPDERWYKTTGRWDHMYVLKDGDTYYGYPVATPHPDLKSAWGLCKSLDGHKWECMVPPMIEWGDIPIIDCLEGGGVEKIGDKYYYIGGFVGYAGNYGYGLYTFVSDNPEGPFKPDKDAFRLCGFNRLPGRVFVQNLAAFAIGKDGELLISNAVVAGGPYEIRLLPLRKAIVDNDGHLRMGYWQGNEALKGRLIPITSQTQNLIYASHLPDEKMPDNWISTEFSPDGNNLKANVDGPNGPVVHDRFLLMKIDADVDLNKGIIYEGSFKAWSLPVYDEERHMTHNWRPAEIGFFVEEEALDGNIKGMAITLEIGHPYKRYSHVKNISVENNILKYDIVDSITEDCAEVRGVDACSEHTFKLLYRKNVFELYVDNMFVQTFVHLGKPTGYVGLYLQNSKVEINDMKIYEMSLQK